jgi:signal transduction histidine kinase
MSTASPAWELRLDWTLAALHWGSFTLAVILSFLADGANAATLASAATAGAYVVAVQTTPRRYRNDESIGELVAVVGVVVSLVAVALTGGIDSPYLLYMAAPSFFAGAFLGLRIGVETAVLTSFGLVAVVAAVGQEYLSGQVVQVALFYLLIALTFAQARRLLVEQQERSAALVEASELTVARIRRLEAAHAALASLSELASSADLNPVTVGEAALRDLAQIVPYAAGQVAIEDDGSLVVATRGVPTAEGEPLIVEMELADRRLGSVTLWPEDGASLTASRGIIEETLRPVTLAFDNILLLRTIAGRAVQEERTRLARELHDEVGPALASLGLGIDMAIFMPDATPEMARQLESIRRGITSLTEDVRRTVADLRHEPVKSLVEQANRLVAEAGADGPSMLVGIDERRTPRPETTTQLAAIMAEAVRNALEHARAQTITISGEVDRTRGTLTIADNGVGFDPEHRPDGHFGLVGMHERAAKIGAAVKIDSARGAGTRITIEWGD